MPCPDLACRRLKASLNYLLCSIEICENLGEYMLLIMRNVLVSQKNIVPTFDSDNGWEASPQVGGEKQERDDHCSAQVHVQCTIAHVHGCWGEVKYMSTYTAYDLRSSCGKPLHRWEGRSRSWMTIVLLK